MAAARQAATRFLHPGGPDSRSDENSACDHNFVDSKVSTQVEMCCIKLEPEHIFTTKVIWFYMTSNRVDKQQSQVKFFGLKTGDTIKGIVRPPKYGERYFPFDAYSISINALLVTLQGHKRLLDME